MSRSRGFTLIELIAVLVIIGVISVSVTSRVTPTTLLQLQANRDVLISALFVAQQKAMSQQSTVQVTTSGSAVDITVGGSSIFSGGITYPLTLPGNVTLSSANITYDGLGHTDATSIVLSKDSDSATITITGTGYAY